MSTGAVQAIHFLGQAGAGLAVQAIGDQQHHGPLGQDSPAPLVVEGVQAMANACATRPVIDQIADLGEGLVDIAVA